MKTFLATILIMFPAAVAADGEILGVVVRDREFNIIRTLDAPSDLRVFESVWATREGTSAELPADFTLILDIAGGPSEGRWHYSEAGLTRILSAKVAATYSISQPEVLNAVLVGR